MLPRRRKKARYNPRYGRQGEYDTPTSLKRKPYAYTQLSPEARKQDAKKAEEAEKKPCCPHCGAAVKKNQKYCPACGQVLSEEEES